MPQMFLAVSGKSARRMRALHSVMVLGMSRRARLTGGTRQPQRLADERRARFERSGCVQRAKKRVNFRRMAREPITNDACMM